MRARSQASRPGMSKTATLQEQPRVEEVAGAASRTAMHGWVEISLVTLFFSALTLAMTWPWVLHMNEAINSFGDVVVQMTSIRWNAHALLTNPFGLFEAPFFYPYQHSLAFSENLIGQTIIAFPLLWLTGNPALAANVNILLSFVLTGLFTYLLVRDVTGNRAAGILSGVAFAFCQFRFMQMGHLHMLATQWFPFTLWALGRGVKGQGSAAREANPRYLWWAAFGFIAMGLSSVYYIYFLALVVVLYVLWWLVFRDRAVQVPWRGLLAHGAGAVLLTAIVLGPALYPYLQTNSELGFSRSIYEVRNWQAEWSYFGNVLRGNWLYAQVLAPGMASISGERELFPGIVPGLLAFVGLIWGRGRERWFYVLLGFVALVLTFGLSRRIGSIEIPLPYALLYDWVPGFKALRVPVRFAVLVDMSIYVLAGYGLARLVGISFGRVKAAVSSKPFSVKGTALPAILTGLILLEFINPLDTSNRRDVSALLQVTEPYGWLARPENSGPVVELPMSGDQNDVWYTFFETRNWQPLVNGFSSFVPPGTVRIKQALDAFPDAYTVTLLQGLEVRHVVVHLWQYPKEAQAAFKAKLDSTKQLKMVDQAGDNYVYEVAPDPWLRRMLGEIGGGTLWVGEARHGSMPALEVLAYTLYRWGLPQTRVGGNIDIGYRPIGSLPFGSAADYALLPNIGGAQDLPFGAQGMRVIEENAAVRLLKRDPGLLASYDITGPSAPNLKGDKFQLSVGETGVSFGGSASGAAGQSRLLDVTFVAFSPSEVTAQTGTGEPVKLAVPAGVSHFSLGPYTTPDTVDFTRSGGDANLLRVDLRSQVAPASARFDYAALMPALISSSQDDSTMKTIVKIVPPKNGGDFTATIDVYVEPWGTHPDGHFGSWSVKVPADGAGHDYAFTLDPIAKQVTTTRDGQQIETFAWVGPPTQGDFRAALSITQGDKGIANIPLYLFTLRGDRLTDSDVETPLLSVIHPSNP